MSTLGKAMISQRRANLGALALGGALAVGVAPANAMALDEVVSLSARVIGIDSRTVACRNVDTRQTVSGSLPDVALDESFDCATLGLAFEAGNLVFLQAEGVDFGSDALNGEATGLQDGAFVTCTNLATAAEATVRVIDGVWDCQNAGLPLEPTDPVLVRIQGLVAQVDDPPPVDSLTLTVAGMDTRTVVCRNNTDPQVITGSLPDVVIGETLDCLALGLTVSSGDEVAMQSNGRNFGVNLRGDFTGVATGIAIRCENRTTAASISFALPAGATSFDCVAEGLVIDNAGDVTVTLRGNAP
ncbi:MAG: hypothetical protein AAGA68_23955 [Pseudomonadota bacterium]